MKVDPVKRIIWSDIARELTKETGVETCRCYGDEFYRYLQREGELPFQLKKGGEADLSGDDDGCCDLIIGWQVLAEDSSVLSPEALFGFLNDQGEALLYGYYRDPRPDDISEWERRRGKDGNRVTIQMPMAGAISMSRISGWLKEGPFDRYTIRKKGIYYQAWLRMGEVSA